MGGRPSPPCVGMPSGFPGASVPADQGPPHALGGLCHLLPSHVPVGTLLRPLLVCWTRAQTGLPTPAQGGPDAAAASCSVRERVAGAPVGEGVAFRPPGQAPRDPGVPSSCRWPDPAELAWGSPVPQAPPAGGVQTGCEA